MFSYISLIIVSFISGHSKFFVMYFHVPIILINTFSLSGLSEFSIIYFFLKFLFYILIDSLFQVMRDFCVVYFHVVLIDVSLFFRLQFVFRDKLNVVLIEAFSISGLSLFVSPNPYVWLLSVCVLCSVSFVLCCTFCVFCVHVLCLVFCVFCLIFLCDDRYIYIYLCWKLCTFCILDVLCLNQPFFFRREARSHLHVVLPGNSSECWLHWCKSLTMQWYFSAG